VKPQTERVLRQLRAHPEGVNETAWAPPWVIDHGKPIQRVAARIWELRQAGFEIRTRRLANQTATYVLEAEPSTSTATLTAGEAAAVTTDRAA
jgi:hypothetical protein